ncbi:MAG: superoxide dismutase [Cytophagales bacterium]
MKVNFLKHIIFFFTAHICSAQFVLPPLPYSYDALEPHFDKMTMEIHHSKHHAAYVSNLNAELAKDSSLKNKSLEQIVSNISKYNSVVRNNAGGHYNHSFFWQLLTPKYTEPSNTSLFKALNTEFGSFDKFKEQFSNAAKNKFGSGWAWLILDFSGHLQICSTSNQDNPLMDIAETKGTPILALDVWEHAYYLKFQNKRIDYINTFWNVVNWSEAEKRYVEALKVIKK